MADNPSCGTSALCEAIAGAIEIAAQEGNSLLVALLTQAYSTAQCDMARLT